MCVSSVVSFFFFNDTATTEIYTLSLHDALPICLDIPGDLTIVGFGNTTAARQAWPPLTTISVPRDRKSTRLNSSHLVISYAVFCLKKKNNAQHIYSRLHSLFL